MMQKAQIKGGIMSDNYTISDKTIEYFESCNFIKAMLQFFIMYACKLDNFGRQLAVVLNQGTEFADNLSIGNTNRGHFNDLILLSAQPRCLKIKHSYFINQNHLSSTANPLFISSLYN